MSSMNSFATKSIKVPGPEHPITIEPGPKRVVVTVDGRIVADTQRALTLREAAYPPVHYIPRSDVDMALLSPSEHTTYCPYKGECEYFHIPTGSSRSMNAVWSYAAPFAAVAAIAGHVAFYPNRVDRIQELAAD